MVVAWCVVIRRLGTVGLLVSLCHTRMLYRLLCAYKFVFVVVVVAHVLLSARGPSALSIVHPASHLKYF